MTDSKPRRNRTRDEAIVEHLTNIIDSYSWMAHGRGPYADHDPGYDEEVKAFVTELQAQLPPGRAEPWQSVLTKARRVDGAEAALSQAASTRGIPVNDRLLDAMIREAKGGE